MLAYNVFRTREIDFYCAVPEDRPVPAFVGSKAWEFRGRLNENPTVKLGMDATSWMVRALYRRSSSP
jgi:hypothetical protein